MAGIWSVCYVLGCLLLRPALGQRPARALTIVATTCAGLFSLLMQLAPSLGTLFVLSGLLGLSFSLFWPPLMGWLSAGTEGTKLGRTIGAFNLSWGSATIFGPFLCGWLSEQDVRLPLLLASVLLAITAFFIASAPPERHMQPAAEPLGAAPDAPLDRETLLRYPAWVGLFLVHFGLGLIVTVFPLAAQDELSLSKTSIGLLLLVRSLTNTTAFYVLGNTSFWHFRLSPMLAANALGLLAFGGLLLFSHAWAIGLLFALVGLSNGLSYSVSIFHGVSGSRNRAGRMAIHEAVLAGGMTAGAVIGGLVYQHAGMVQAYWLTAVLLVLAFPLQWAMSQRTSMARIDMRPDHPSHTTT
jgi:predicted MFS family arabinose efflux permease